MFIFSVKTDELLKVTTLLPSKNKSSPVCGFLPLLFFFSFTQNFPNPLTRISSPDARVLFISSRSASTICEAWFLGRSSLFGRRWLLRRAGQRIMCRRWDGLGAHDPLTSASFLCGVVGRIPEKGKIQETTKLKMAA